MLFVWHPKILRKHCFEFLLGVKMAQEKRKQCLYKILGWQTKSIVVCYGIFCSGQYNNIINVVPRVFSYSSLWSDELERTLGTRCNVNCSLWARSLARIRGKSRQPRKITFPRHILLMWWRLGRQKCSSNLHELACSQATLIEITVLISGTLFELSLSLTLCCRSLNLQAHHGGTFIVKPPTKTWASTYEHIWLGE